MRRREAESGRQSWKEAERGGERQREAREWRIEAQRELERGREREARKAERVGAL